MFRSFFVILLLSMLIGASFGSPRTKSSFAFTQKVDHFDPLSKESYQQRYYSWNDPSLSQSAPVFLFIGGEAAVEFFEFQEVSAIQWAIDLGARYFALEHRFYGHSNPRPSLSTDNLRLLTSSQALADAANFITTLKANFTGPWIVLGCSYSGALSAWFRSKYPALAVASVAPSGPTFAVSNFTLFNNNFGNVAPASCVIATKQASLLMADLLQTETGRSKISKLFNSCKEVREDDVTFFLWTVSDWMATNAQWENPPGFQLTAACKNLTQGASSAAQYLFNWGAAFAAQSPSCTPFTVEDYAKPLRDPSLGNDNRAWLFQQCTEFGFFDGANYPGTSIFYGNVSIDFLEQFCSLAFGRNLRPDTAATNAYYGGYNVTGTNIYFTNGAFDPWHTLSVTSVSPSSGQYSNVYAAAHCAPMTAPTSQDPISLTQTRANVRQFLADVLAQYSQP